MSGPSDPLIYHITHIENIAPILDDDRLLPDSVMHALGGATIIGNTDIKLSRLTLPVHCHPGTFVGDYVPFYFCPRSIMLYVIYRANNPQLVRRDGQVPVIHLVSRLSRVVEWAKRRKRKWAFTTMNAASKAAEFFSDLNRLPEIDWDSVKEHSWTGCRDQKQAEFLLHEDFPWHLFHGIGVINDVMGAKVERLISKSAHRPVVRVKRGWYY